MVDVPIHCNVRWMCRVWCAERMTVDDDSSSFSGFCINYIMTVLGGTAFAKGLHSFCVATMPSYCLGRCIYVYLTNYYNTQLCQGELQRINCAVGTIHSCCPGKDKHSCSPGKPNTTAVQVNTNIPEVHVKTNIPAAHAEAHTTTLQTNTNVHVVQVNTDISVVNVKTYTPALQVKTHIFAVQVNTQLCACVCVRACLRACVRACVFFISDQS